MSNFTPRQRQKIFRTVLLVTAVVLAIVLMFTSIFGKEFNEDNVGREVSISWEEVNVREGHSTSTNVIACLNEGASVTLTGNSYEYAGGNGKSTESWTEIQLEDGTIGWVVTRSIKWY